MIRYEIIQDKIYLIDDRIGLNIVGDFSCAYIDKNIEGYNLIETSEEMYLMKDKKRCGECRLYYPSKKLQAKVFYYKDLLHGPSCFYSEKEELLSKSWFYMGKRQGEMLQYYPEKKKYSRQFFLDDSWEGKQEFYYKNGQIKTILQYHHSRANGKSTLYYENGKIKRETNFLNGKRDGFDRIYTEEGILIDEGEYKQNKPISIHRRWNERSNLLEKRIFHEAGYFDLFKWDEKNNNIFEGIFQKDGKYKERKKEGEKIIEKNGCWDGKKLIIT